MLLLFDNLIHENGLVHSLRRVQTRRSLAISLDLVLVTHGDRTKEQDGVQVSLTDDDNCFCFACIFEFDFGTYSW